MHVEGKTLQRIGLVAVGIAGGALLADRLSQPSQPEPLKNLFPKLLFSNTVLMGN